MYTYEGNAVDTRRPHGERGEHPRLYKQGHPKGAPSSSAAADGEATRRGSSPPQGVKLSSTTTTAFHSEPYQVEEQSSFTNNFTNSSKKHLQTEKHIRSSLALHEFGINRIEIFLRNSFEPYNKKVERNRNLMKRFIDTIILLGRQELSFRGHDVKLTSDNRGNYIETLLFLKTYDSVLDMHLEQCFSTRNSVFSGLSSDIQNDLIKSIAQVIRDEIKSEINFAKFVSVIADETPDISHREQMSVIFRYLTKTGIEEICRFSMLL
ncbi:Zinc finger MYM-type protein 1 [Eumeta japonica]|uniref:Zinc finger MYM-type protein 1 n=1 Tax=Eumeta variegata TaxID=151549 RepID=A0A4C1WUP4_EUMVA|nr:Zinc finger MYM-type protein 1 [Eumeta japonica]